MKKLSLIFGLALGMLTVACSQDPMGEENNLPVANGTVTLGVTLEEPAEAAEAAEARTALGEFSGNKYLVVWSAGDNVLVNGKASQAVDAAYVGSSEAKFVVEDVTAPYSVLYPANALDAEGYLVVPTAQSYTAGSFANGSAVMAGYSAEENVALKHLFSFVKLTVAKGVDTGDALASITVTSLSGRALSGSFEVDYKNTAINPAAGKGVDNTTVSNIPYVDGKAVVYLAVPAGEYVDGLEVSIVGADGLVMTKTAYTTTGVDLPAGYLLNMPELTYAGEAVADKVITTGDQLVNFLCVDLAQGGTFTGVAKLGADIDMTGQVLDGNTAVLLEGATLDGQGHSIKNWTATQGLIYENYGTVKNIVLDKSCQFSYDLTSAHKACGFVVMCNVTGTVSGCVNNANVISDDNSVDITGNRFLGTIVGCTAAGVNPSNADPYDPDKFDYKGANTNGIHYENARVENCINNGKVVVSANSYNSGWLHIGGVAGIYWQHVQAGVGGFFNCINNGDVQVNINSNDKVTAIGGIVAAAGKIYPNPGGNTLCYLILENCINNGSVSYTCNTKNDAMYMGGITGYQSGKSISLVNNGSVIFNVASASKGNKFIGGIAGLFTNEVDDCHNTGNVTVENYEFINNLFYVGGLFACWSGYDDTTKTYLFSNSTNSGVVTAMYSTELDTIVAFGGLVGYVGNKSTINSKQYVGRLKFVDCKNSGDIFVDRQGVAQTRAMVGGLLGYYEKGETLVRCVNEGNLTANISGNANETSVAGMAGTLYLGMEDCKQLGNLTLNCSDETGGAIIGGFGARQGNSNVNWDGCVLKTEISYTAEKGIICGLLQGDYWGSSKALTVGAVTPCVVKSASKVNGEAVTAEQLKEHSFLVGRDQKVADGTIANSMFVIAEGGLVLE